MKKYKYWNKVILYSANFLRNLPLSISAIFLYFMPEVISYGNHLSREYKAFHSIVFLLYGLIASMIPLLIGIILEIKPSEDKDEKLHWGYVANAIIGFISTVFILTLGIMLIVHSGPFFSSTPENIAGLVCSIICVLELFWASLLGGIGIDSKLCIPTFKIFPTLCGKFHKTGSMVVGTCGLLGTIICSIQQNFYNIGVVLLTLIIIFVTLWIMIYKVKLNAKLQNKPTHVVENKTEPLIKDIIMDDDDKI